MENEYRQGCELPLTRDRTGAWTALILLVLDVCVVEWLALDVQPGDPQPYSMRVFYPFLLVLAVMEFLRSFARLRLEPEGIDTVLFGKRIRHFPREDIRFLGGLIYNAGRGGFRKYICVCGRSMYQLADEQERRTPEMFRDPPGTPGWSEGMARAYLIRYVRNGGKLGDSATNPILLLEWSPECLALLEQMYPLADWVDLSERKLLDAERMHRE